MHFQFDVSTFITPRYEPPAAAETDVSGLLRQLLAVQREQLAHLRTLTATLNSSSRWQAFLARWRDDLPNLSPACRQAMAVLEKAYGQVLLELAEQLNESGEEAISTDFDLQEFLDRHGPRLAQLGHILNAVAPLTEGQPPQE